MRSAAFLTFVRELATDYAWTSTHRDLEQAVEDLSGMLEEPIDADTISELRQKVTDKTVYVHKRNEIVLNETARDYQDGRVVWRSEGALFSFDPLALRVLTLDSWSQSPTSCEQMSNACGSNLFVRLSTAFHCFLSFRVFACTIEHSPPRIAANTPSLTIEVDCSLQMRVRCACAMRVCGSLQVVAVGRVRGRWSDVQDDGAGRALFDAFPTFGLDLLVGEKVGADGRGGLSGAEEGHG